MPKRIRHGSKLIQQSFAVILQHKKLFIFPILATIFVAALLTGVLTPLAQHEQTIQLIEKGELHHVLWFYVFVLVFFFFMHQIIFYFNSALTQCSLEYFEGKTPSLADGIKLATRRFAYFFLWNLFTGTIGIFIFLFQKKIEKYSLYQKIFQGLRWQIATYLTVPTILVHKTGPLKTIKISASLMQKTWGTHLRAKFGFITLLIIARLLSLIPLIITLFIGGKINILIGSSITVALLLFISMTNTATRTILSSALFYYATNGASPSCFEEDLLDRAFEA